jgi:hypothetical protein
MQFESIHFLVHCKVTRADSVLETEFKVTIT